MLKIVDRIEDVIMLTAFTAALSLGIYQVVLRYVFSRGYQWMEGTIVLLTLWAALFGGSRAIRDRIHARVGLIADALPPRPRKVVHLIAIAITLSFLVPMFVFGYQYVDFVHGIGVRSLRVQIPTWQVYLLVPTFLGFYVVRYLAEFVRIWRAKEPILTAGVNEELTDEFIEEQLGVRDETARHGHEREERS